MQLLLKHGADPKIATANGDTALTASAGIGWVEGVTYERSAKENLEAIRMLLDLGLDPNGANNEGRTPLMGAAMKGRTDVIQLLVDRGAMLDQHDHGSRDTDKVASIAAGATWQAIDYAEGLVRPSIARSTRSASSGSARAFSSARASARASVHAVIRRQVVMHQREALVRELRAFVQHGDERLLPFLR
jgi:ankyrin repeat protein